MTCRVCFPRSYIGQLIRFGTGSKLTSESHFGVSLARKNFCSWNVVHPYNVLSLRNKKMKCMPILPPKMNPTDKFISTSKIHMEKSEVKLSRKDQLKKAVKDYGSTVVVFHITISLASLGFFYVLVSSGIDMEEIMNYFGVHLKFAQNAGTFVTAYAIHKLFAPVRIC
ncbi:hypothetical protein WA026_006855 [Henosepilachna vigintioctopunctata]|uniref:DUF1279 domain-containing protein n=1 Tax=Henosepilachna vigintioctopunctata TaxID=420089 RepID=A0AAW1UFI0_9CUCU